MTCASLEANQNWDCSGCSCPGDLSCEEQGLITCENGSEDGTGCAVNLDECCGEFGCVDNSCSHSTWGSFAFDGMCDEGENGMCAPGTDCYDCGTCDLDCEEQEGELCACPIMDGNGVLEGGSSANAVWHEVVIPENVLQAELSLCGTDFDTFMRLYNGSDCVGIIPPGYNDIIVQNNDGCADFDNNTPGDTSDDGSWQASRIVLDNPDAGTYLVKVSPQSAFDDVGTGEYFLSVTFVNEDVTCDEETACNYGDTGDCEFAQENFDCDGNCLAELDCNDECGGSAVSDECGVCGGDGTTCTELTLDILFDSDTDIAGFQFNIEGATITSTSGGAAGNAGFSVSSGESTVVGFSFGGVSIPAGSGVLTTIVLESSNEEPCLSGLVLSGPGGVTLESEVINCLTAFSGSNNNADILGCTDPNALNYNSEATIDDDTCQYSCLEDEYVASGVCVSCPDGFSNEPGDDPSGADTQCDETVQNEYVVDITYESDAAIAGFQFNVDGAELISANGGAAQTAGFTVSTGQSTVIGFSFQGTSIPAGAGVLTTLTLLGEDACLSGLVLSGENGLTLTGSQVLNCFNLSYTGGDGGGGSDIFGCTDESASNFNPDATLDDGSCSYPPVLVNQCTDDDILILDSQSEMFPSQDNSNVILGCIWNCVLGGASGDGVEWCIVNACGWGETFSDGCNGCYGDFGSCMDNNCSECHDLDGWDEDCSACLDEQCWPEFESCSGVVYGCDEESACNFEEGANMDAQGCEYPSLNFDCDGNCLVETDCNGVCGGLSELDGCGICDGDDSSCNNISLSFSNFNPDGSIDILYNSSGPIAGFQLDITGLSLTSWSGGAAEDAGFEVTVGQTTIIGFSLDGNTIPSGSGVLLTLSFSDILSDVTELSIGDFGADY